MIALSLSVRTAHAAAALRLRRVGVDRALLTQLDLVVEHAALFLVGRELHAHRLDLRVHRRAPALELALPPLGFLLARLRVDALLRLVGVARRADQDAARADRDGQQADPQIG